MPDWKRVASDVSRAVDGIARETSQLRKSSGSRRSPLAIKRAGRQKQCLFWNCNANISPDHFMCLTHYAALQEGKVDECPGCNRAKDTQYELCLDCRNNRSRQRQDEIRFSTSNRWYSKEYSPEWDKRDATATEFFVYILKMDGGRFYVGQTRELRERISEHRDGNTKSTAGKNPKLVWFAQMPSSDAATTREVELKKLVDCNPRNPPNARRMVVRFQDLIREVDYD